MPTPNPHHEVLPYPNLATAVGLDLGDTIDPGARIYTDEQRVALAHLFNAFGLDADHTAGIALVPGHGLLAYVRHPLHALDDRGRPAGLVIRVTG